MAVADGNLFFNRSSCVALQPAPTRRHHLHASHAARPPHAPRSMPLAPRPMPPAPRPGRCGVLETAEIVAEAAHPELRGLLGHHGKRWVWLSELEAFATRDGAELPSTNPNPNPDPDH